MTAIYNEGKRGASGLICVVDEGQHEVHVTDRKFKLYQLACKTGAMKALPKVIFHDTVKAMCERLKIIL